jgi:hypothetical protein
MHRIHEWAIPVHDHAAGGDLRFDLLGDGHDVRLQIARTLVAEPGPGLKPMSTSSTIQRMPSRRFIS